MRTNGIVERRILRDLARAGVDATPDEHGVYNLGDIRLTDLRALTSLDIEELAQQAQRQARKALRQGVGGG